METSGVYDPVEPASNYRRRRRNALTGVVLDRWRIHVGSGMAEGMPLIRIEGWRDDLSQFFRRRASDRHEKNPGRRQPGTIKIGRSDDPADTGTHPGSLRCCIRGSSKRSAFRGPTDT